MDSKIPAISFPCFPTDQLPHSRVYNNKKTPPKSKLQKIFASFLIFFVFVVPSRLMFFYKLGFSRDILLIVYAAHGSWLALCTYLKMKFKFRRPPACPSFWMVGEPSREDPDYLCEDSGNLVLHTHTPTHTDTPTHTVHTHCPPWQRDDRRPEKRRGKSFFKTGPKGLWRRKLNKMLYDR